MVYIRFVPDRGFYYIDMAPKVKNNSEFLQKIYKGGVRARKQAVSSATPRQVRALCECALNACSGRFKVKPAHLRSLRANESKLLRLAYAKDPIETKRKILIQSGGALPVLAALGLSALGSLIPSLLGR
jgi:hypothetical protein